MLRSTDTSNTALAGRYDDIPYHALPHRATHPRGWRPWRHSSATPRRA
jgi:hypothetical protein